MQEMEGLLKIEKYETFFKACKIGNSSTIPTLTNLHIHNFECQHLQFFNIHNFCRHIVYDI